MDLYDDFYEKFKIEKIEYESPGRDYDDDGLSSWYIEMDYPCIDEEILGKLICILCQYREEADLDGIYIKGDFINIKNTILQGLLDLLFLLKDNIDKQKYLIADVHGAFED